MDWVYLDNNATTRPAPEVADAVDHAMRELWANPSSVHRFGQQVRQQIELARRSVASLIGAQPREILLTSGGTESDNLALFGASLTLDKLTLITTKIEHAAVRSPAERITQLGGKVFYASVDRAGVVDVESVKALLAEHATPLRTTLVSVQWANNETGVLQPAGEIALEVQGARERAAESGQRLKLLMHLDATQAVGKVSVDVASAGCDLLTLSAHKFHGPKGVGALFIRQGVRLHPTQLGGAQESDRRGGTENVPGIIGMGIAAELARAFVSDTQAVDRLRAMRDRFERGVCAAMPSTVINSGGAPRLWNTTNLGFPGIEAEAILMGLSEQGICASAGAACSSGSLDPSPVLLAMGIPEPVAHGSVRFSLSRYSTDDEIDRVLEALPRVVGRLMKTLPTGH